MRSVLIVIDAPRFNLVSGIVQRDELCDSETSFHFSSGRTLAGACRLRAKSI